MLVALSCCILYLYKPVWRSCWRTRNQNTPSSTPGLLYNPDMRSESHSQRCTWCMPVGDLWKPYNFSAQARYWTLEHGTFPESYDFHWFSSCSKRIITFRPHLWCTSVSSSSWAKFDSGKGQHQNRRKWCLEASLSHLQNKTKWIIMHIVIINNQWVYSKLQIQLE